MTGRKSILSFGWRQHWLRPEAPLGQLARRMTLAPSTGDGLCADEWQGR